MYYFEVFEDDGIMPAGRLGWVESDVMPNKAQALDLMMRLARHDTVDSTAKITCNIVNAPRDCVAFVWKAEFTRVVMLQWPEDLYRNVPKSGAVVKLESNSSVQ